MASNSINTELNVPESGTKSFPSYSKSELTQMQQSDPTISSFLKLWRVGEKPNGKERKDLTIGTRVLLQQWKQLKLKDGVLYRTIIDPQEQEVQQLVLPEILTERVIRSVIKPVWQATPSTRNLMYLNQERSHFQATPSPS